MTPALELLERLAAAGLDVEPDGTGRVIVAPRDRLTSSLRAEICRNRDELLELLTAEHWHWRVTLPGREPFTVWVTPGANHDWMARLYPGATASPLLRDVESAMVRPTDSATVAR